MLRLLQAVEIQQPPIEERTPSPGSFSPLPSGLIRSDWFTLKAITDPENGVPRLAQQNRDFPPMGDRMASQSSEAPSPKEVGMATKSECRLTVA